MYMPTNPTPSLREVQRALRASLVGSDVGVAGRYVVADGIAPEGRLSVYRNTYDGTLANALRLSYPAVHKLVGAEFLEGAARLFAHEHPPRTSCLDVYGADFADFLAAFAPAASLPYLPDVARLEWAVNCALHAPDTQPLDANRLATVNPGLHERLRFVVDPSVSLLVVEYPADAIWRAVLDGDDAALAAVDLADGPVRLLVQRLATGVEVVRIDELGYRITAALLAGQSLGMALASDPAAAAAVLADHLTASRFVGFEIAPDSMAVPITETPL
jgi:hypothetical protein